MIDFFNVWLPQIIGYAETVRDGRLRTAWETSDRQATSPYFSGELDEQVFGDLQAEHFAREMRGYLKNNPALADALVSFLHSMSALIRSVDTTVDVNRWGTRAAIPQEVSGIFELAEWQDFSDHADAVLRAASLAGYSSKNFKPS